MFKFTNKRGKKQPNINLETCIQVSVCLFLLKLSANIQVASQQTNSILSTFQYPVIERCTNGAPLQWRPHLDAASKAHLAPVVALGTLRHMNLTPIQLQSHHSGYNSRQQQQALMYHLQSVNNVGVTIEATFSVTNILKRPATMLNLKPLQDVRLIYHISAPLSTTSALMTLANSGNTSTSDSASTGTGTGTGTGTSGRHSASGPQTSGSSAFQIRGQMLQPNRFTRLGGDSLSPSPCTLELSEQEFTKKVNKLFKLNQNYIIFLDQSQSQTQALGSSRISAPRVLGPNAHYYHRVAQSSQQYPQVVNQRYHNHHSGQQQQQQSTHPQYVEAPALQLASLQPFASHEPLTNQTSRSVSKILCKNCGKYLGDGSRVSSYRVHPTSYTRSLHRLALNGARLPLVRLWVWVWLGSVWVLMMIG